MSDGSRAGTRVGAAVELAALLGAAAVWAWWLGPQQSHPLAWAPLPGWTWRLDTLSLVFLTLFLAVPAPALIPATVQGQSPVLQTNGAGRRGRLPALGWLVCRAGLALTALAGPLAGQIAGLALAGAGLALAAWPLGMARVLAPLLLVPVAVSGAFDLIPAPGRPVPLLPWPLIGLALAAAAGGAGAWPFGGPHPARPASARTGQGAWMATLYAAASLLPLLRSLGAGAWDPWARLGALAVGLLTLAVAGCAALAAADSPGAARAVRDALVGTLLVGLGLGTPGAVGGALLLFVAGLIGLALVGSPSLAQWIGRGTTAGLPPTLGFAGLWLLLGTAATTSALLALAAVPVAGLLAALAQARLAPPSGPARPAAILLAGGLLLSGLLPGPLLDGVLRPALSPLAAGLPAASALQAWPGVGLLLAPGPTPVAVWPAWGVAATLVLTLAGAEILARFLQVHHGDTETRSSLPDQPDGPLLPGAAQWAHWIDPGSLIRAGVARRGP